MLFPDFFKNATIDWWSSEIKTYYDTVLKFDGLWIGKLDFILDKLADLKEIRLLNYLKTLTFIFYAKSTNIIKIKKNILL